MSPFVQKEWRLIVSQPFYVIRQEISNTRSTSCFICIPLYQKLFDYLQQKKLLVNISKQKKLSREQNAITYIAFPSMRILAEFFHP